MVGQMDVKSGGLLVDQKAAMMVKRWVDWKGCCLAVPKEGCLEAKLGQNLVEMKGVTKVLRKVVHLEVRWGLWKVAQMENLRAVH